MAEVTIYVDDDVVTTVTTIDRPIETETEEEDPPVLGVSVDDDTEVEDKFRG